MSLSQQQPPPYNTVLRIMENIIEKTGKSDCGAIISPLLQLSSATKFCFNVEQTREQGEWLATKYDAYFTIFILYQKIATLPKIQLHDNSLPYNLLLAVYSQKIPSPLLRNSLLRQFSPRTVHSSDNSLLGHFAPKAIHSQGSSLQGQSGGYSELKLVSNDAPTRPAPKGGILKIFWPLCGVFRH